jgi:Zn-dependent protease
MQYDPNQVYEADYRVNDDGSVEQRSKKPSWLKGALGPLGAGLIFVATKAKFLLVALKGVKFVGTGLTALLSVGAYALYFGWQFAIGLVALIFIHEMGHVLVLGRYGVKATAPIFIPFLGAYIGMKELPKNATMEAFVGLGGPVVGSIGAMAAWGVYRLTDNTLFLALAFVGLILNLFNLLPILPLDGGRAVGAISRWLWVAGYGALIALLLVRPSPILFIILLFGAPEAWSAFRGRGHADYYRVPPADRLTVAVIYFGLIFVLGFTLHELQPLMEANRP